MMPTRTLCATVAAIGLALSGYSARASVIDFNTLPGPNGAGLNAYFENNFIVAVDLGPWQEELTGLGNPPPSIAFQPVGPATGSVKVTQSTTGLFTFASVDLETAGTLNYTITGSRQGSTVLSQSGSLPTPNSFTAIPSVNSSVVMDTLTIVTSVGNTSGAVIDNINVTALSPPSVLCPGFPNGEETAPYGPVTCSASGGSGSGYQFSAQGLPTGLTIGASSGTVSGVPVAGSHGTYSTVTISVTDSNGFTGNLPIPPLTIGVLALPACPVTAGEELVPYVPVVCTVASGTPPYSWSATGLPTGLTINSSTGVIAGTPAAGSHNTYPTAVTVQDSAGALAVQYTAPLVIDPPPVPNCPTLPDGQEGIAYAGVACTATGGSGSYNWSASGLPNGLTINSSTGAIGGTPAAGAAKTYSSVQVTVKDSLGGTATFKASALVIHPGPVITSLSPSTAAAGSGDFTLTVNGTGFSSGATVQWNGTPLTTTFVSAAELTAAVPAALLSSAGSIAIKVVQGIIVTAGAPFTVNSPGQPCTFILTPSSASFGAAGGSAGISVTASRSDCTWTATSSASFITFSNNNLTGSGTLNYNVSANTAGTSRTGTISIGAQSFAVAQGGVTCIYSLPITSQSFPAAGGPGTAAVQAPPGCVWTATSASPFITISAPAGGSGDGSVAFTVTANPSLAGRSDTFTLANQPFAVSQAGTGATLSCAAGVPSVPQVALEGRTEVLGDYVVNCSGLAGPLTADFTLILNTNVTNALTDFVTDAVLTVNGGAPQNAIVTSYNSVQWPGVVVSPAGDGTAVLRISKVRADASLLATPGNLQPAPITGQLNVSALITVPIASPRQTMANAAPSLAFTKSQASPPTGGTRTLIPLLFQETSAGSFQPAVTRLRITLTNIPAAVEVLAPVFPAEGAAQAQLYSADSSGAGGSPVAGASQPEGTYQPLAVTQGTTTATWVVLASSPSAIQTWTFPLLVLNAAAGDLNQIQVTGSLAPVSDIGIASATAPVPRYRDFSVPQKLVNLRMSISLNSPPPAPRAPVAAGSNVTYTQQLVNDTSDPTQVATNVIIRDNLPSGLSLVSCSAIGGTVCNSSGNQVQVSYPSLGAGQSETVMVTAAVDPTLPDGTVIQNAASGSSDQATQDPSAATASVSFIVNDVPLTVGITPSSGASSSQSFQFQFSHPAGYQNLGVVDMLINNSLDGRHACYLAYVVQSSTLVLVDDVGDAGGPYAGSVPLGSSSTIQNSQCAVNLVSAAGSGATLTLTLNIAFKPAFGGDRIVFVAAVSQSLANSDWQPLGVWQVPGPPPAPVTIAVTGASPARWAAAAGSNKQFTFTLTDTAGAGDLGVVNVLINKFIDGRQACYLAYVASTNTLLLVDDSGDAGGPYAGSMVLSGTSASIENSQCQVSSVGSVVAPGPGTLALTLDITLKSAFAGNRVIYLAGRDRSDGNSTGWQAAATWSVQ